jgi:hypothetical protein
MSRLPILTALLLTALLAVSPADAASPKKDPKRFQPADVFQLEFASDPQVHPDGRSVV